MDVRDMQGNPGIWEHTVGVTQSAQSGSHSRTVAHSRGQVSILFG